MLLSNYQIDLKLTSYFPFRLYTYLILASYIIGLNLRLNFGFLRLVTPLSYNLDRGVGFHSYINSRLEIRRHVVP